MYIKAINVRFSEVKEEFQLADNDVDDDNDVNDEDIDSSHGDFFLVQGGVFHVDSDKGNDGHDDDDDVMTMV